MTKLTLELDVEQTKYDALKVYLERKNSSLEAEISRQIEVLFNKNVPTAVREFISVSGENKKNERRPKATNEVQKNSAYTQEDA